MSSRASDRRFNSRSSGCREPYRVSLRPHCLGAKTGGVKPSSGVDDTRPCCHAELDRTIAFKIVMSLRMHAVNAKKKPGAWSDMVPSSADQPFNDPWVGN